MVRLRRIHKKYLTKENVRKVYKYYYKKSIKSIFDFDFDNFFPPVEMFIYQILREVYKLAEMNIYKFTACYKCFSIKNLGLKSYEYSYILLPLQMKLHFNFVKIHELQKCRWMDIEKIFTDEKAFVNKEKQIEFEELCKNHYYYCFKVFSLFFRKIDENINKMTNDDFLKIMKFFKEESRDFEHKLLIYSVKKNTTYPLREMLLDMCITIN